MATRQDDLTAANSSTAQVIGDTLAKIALSGTYAGAEGVIEGSMDGTNYSALAAIADATASVVSGTLALSDDSEVTYTVDVRNLTHVRFRLTALTSGTVSIRIQSGHFDNQAPPIIVSFTGGTQTITSAAAAALAVGPNGATNPSFLVDASTASAATGVKVKSAAAAGGVAVSVVSSGTNESLTIDAKGSGTISLNATGTGAILVGQNLQVADGKNVVLDTTTGTKIGTATTQKLGFYNATPVAQRSAYTQTFSTADKTHAAATAAALTDNTAGTANTTLQALADGTTYANDVAAIRNNFADLAASNNAIIVDLDDVKRLCNSIIDDLQALGLVG